MAIIPHLRRSSVSAHPPALHADATMMAIDKRAQRNIMIAMITALVAVLAAMSGLNVAQQEMAIDLGASQSGVLWIINAYTVALAALLLPVGAIGDRFGRKPVLLAGLAVFGLATVGSRAGDDDGDDDRRPRRRRRRRGDDHAGHAVDHHLELPARGPRQGDRHLGRLRRWRQHDRDVRVGVHRRRAHVAVGVRTAARAGRRLGGDEQRCMHRTRRRTPATGSTPSARCCRRWPSAAWCSASTRGLRRGGAIRSPSWR